jgi:hypothetical protein
LKNDALDVSYLAIKCATYRISEDEGGIQILEHLKTISHCLDITFHLPLTPSSWADGGH